MVKSKRRATKSKSAAPMTPPRSPEEEVKQPVIAQGDPSTIASGHENSTSDSDLPPLPKERAQDQHPITSFFKTQPAKNKGKRVLEEDDKEKGEELKQVPQIAKRKKLPVRRSVKVKQVPQSEAQAPASASTMNAPLPDKQIKPKSKTDEPVVTTPRKRRSEVEILNAQGQAMPRTRQSARKIATAPLEPTSSKRTGPSSPPAHPTSTTSEHEESRPKMRRKQIAKKSRREDFDTNTFYPFISSKARASFESTIKHKQPIRERTLDWEAAEAFIKDIITSLHWEQFCQKPDEGALMLIKEFYANFENMVDNRVFVRGVWVLVTSEELNRILGTPDYLEDAYSLLIETGIAPHTLASKLCVQGDKVAWSTGKNNQPLSFPTSALRPHLIPLLKFICCRLIPTTHTSHVTVDRATLLLAMIEKREVDAGWIIYNNLLESSGAGKGLWFPAIITKLCVQAGVKVAKEEEKVKAGLQIHAKATSDYVLHPVGTPRAASGIGEELKQISASLRTMIAFISEQKAWNKFMEQAWKETIASINLPFAAGTSPPQDKAPTARKAMKKKTPTTQKAPPSAKGKEPIISDEEEDEEEIATHLGGGEPLTGHFTSANMSSEDEESD